MNNPHILVLPQTRDSFLSGVQLYENRPDKEYSLPDCISMQVMRQMGITEILTHDRHFAQEGFVILLTKCCTAIALQPELAGRAIVFLRLSHFKT